MFEKEYEIIEQLNNIIQDKTRESPLMYIDEARDAYIDYTINQFMTAMNIFMNSSQKEIWVKVIQKALDAIAEHSQHFPFLPVFSKNLKNLYTQEFESTSIYYSNGTLVIPTITDNQIKNLLIKIEAENEKKPNISYRGSLMLCNTAQYSLSYNFDKQIVRLILNSLHVLYSKLPHTIITYIMQCYMTNMYHKKYGSLPKNSEQLDLFYATTDKQSNSITIPNAADNDTIEIAVAAQGQNLPF